ncbi:MAG: histidine phosphatase family protein [Chloroflexi bacterium]|nr:histidine phosphatase family protein [Chloroflexota bacterium]
MIIIYFEAHATSLDNETGISSGHYDVELSEAGREMAAGEKRQRFRGVALDAAFTSDTRRAYDTARIMLEGKDVPIVQDARLREWDYGDLTRHPRAEVEAAKAQSISKPFPNGESLKQAVARMKSFLDELSRTFDGETALVVGHLATYYGLEHHLNGVPLAELLAKEARYSAKYALRPPS